MATAAAALKVAAVCTLLLCVGSDLAGPAMASTSMDDQEAAGAGAGAVLRELLLHELAEKLGLIAAGQDGAVVGPVCTPACQNCLIVCAITCVLNADPAACFANCTVTTGCFSKALLVA